MNMYESRRADNFEDFSENFKGTTRFTKTISPATFMTMIFGEISYFSEIKLIIIPATVKKFGESRKLSCPGFRRLLGSRLHIWPLVRDFWKDFVQSPSPKAGNERLLGLFEGLCAKSLTEGRKRGTFGTFRGTLCKVPH